MRSFKSQWRTNCNSILRLVHNSFPDTSGKYRPTTCSGMCELPHVYHQEDGRKALILEPLQIALTWLSRLATSLVWLPLMLCSLLIQSACNQLCFNSISVKSGIVWKPCMLNLPPIGPTRWINYYVHNYNPCETSVLRSQLWNRCVGCTCWWMCQ